MSFKAKLYSLVAFFIASIVLLVLVTLASLHRLEINGPTYTDLKKNYDLLADILPPPYYLLESYLVTLQLKKAEPSEIPELIKKSQSLASDFDTRYAYWNSNLPAGGIREVAINKLYPTGKAFLNLQQTKYVDAIAAGKTKDADLIFDDLTKLYLTHRKAVDELVDLSTKDTSEREATVDHKIKWLNVALLLMIVAAIVISLIVAFFIVRSVTNMIAFHLNHLTKVADQIEISSAEVARGSQSLSQSVSEQAAALEETSASVEEIASMSKQNADNSRQARVLSEKVTELTAQGGTTMEKMNHAIGEIKSSSGQTGAIVKTIEDIAFQTNLLALNAAIEAARAGEAGKGFAVVAEEVRTLAQRSANAAKETAEKINGSIELSEKGAKASEEAVAALSLIQQNIAKTADLIREIAAASEEQSAGLGQISEAVSKLDQSTQQNSASSEESAAAGEELASQAKAINDIVSEVSIALLSRAKPTHS